MKKILLLVFCLCSIICYAQSDLNIDVFYAGNQYGDNYRENPIDWGFKVTNIGNTNADIVLYKIYISEDQTIDTNDVEVLDGLLGNNPFVPTSGLDSNNDVLISSTIITTSKLDFPPLLSANKQYYIILKVFQDINGGETELTNNTSVVPFYLKLSNKLEIIEVHPNESLETQIPLFLVHGWQPEAYDQPGNLNIWNNFKSYFISDLQLSDTFKLYYVKYNSNIVPVNDLGHELRIELDNMTEIHDRQIFVLAHSMGGLVARSFAKRNRIDGPFPNEKGGERINKLITLGTPHHGSPMANGEVRTTLLNLSSTNSELIGVAIWTLVDNSIYNISTPVTGVVPTSSEFNRWDLRWDNHDGLFDYTLFPYAQNTWLNSQLMNGDPDNYFDDKIITYGGYFTDTSLLLDTDNRYYFPQSVLKNYMEYLNDGIVPLESALFENHNVFKRRMFIDYYHDEIAKGNPDNFDIIGIDRALFDMIKVDLLSSLPKSHILSNEQTINYPETAINNSSSKDITISNTGDLPLTINSIQLIGSDNAQFNFNFPTDPFDIQPNQTETFTVDFSPTSTGNKSVTFRINNSSDNNSQLDIQLSGIAVQTASTNYDTNTNPMYNFGDVYIYGGSEFATMTVSNSSSATYTITGLNITGTDADLFTIVDQPNLPIILPPGGSDIIILSFTPNTIGEKNAIIEMSFQNSSIISTANLSGTGVNNFTNPNSPKLTNYEYWFNNDYANKQSIDISGTNSNEVLSFTANTTHTSNGLNTLHFRTKDSNNAWSSISSDYVYIHNGFNSNSSNIVISYEYWLENDYSNKIEGTTTNQSLITLNLEALTNISSNGLKKLNIRFKDSKNQWSSIISEYVIIYNDFGNNTSNNILSYEYWFDDNYNNKISGNTDNENLLIFNSDINTSTLNKGLHKFHIRFKDNKQTWSSVQTDFIIKTNENAVGFNEISGYRYWFNQDFMTVTSIDIPTSENFTLLDDIDMSSFTSETTNYIHFQFKDIYGNWSSVITEEVFICGIITAPTISASGNLLSTINASTYQWYLDGVIIDGATNQYYEANIEGDYTVEITNLDGCRILSEIFQFNTLNLESNEIEYFRIFPNPTKNKVFIVTNEYNGILSIYNTTGQLVKFYDIIPNEIDISKLNNGIYFFRIKTNNKVQTEKIIKL